MLCSTHFASVFIGILGVASTAVSHYILVMWMPSYLRAHGLAPSNALLVTMVGKGLGLILLLPIGWLADIVGIGSVMMASACLLTLLGCPLFSVVVSDPTNLTLSILCIGIILAAVGVLSVTVVSAFVAELFPASVRNTGMGVSYNVGVSLFGGFVPMIAQASLSISPLGPGLLLSSSGAVTASALLLGWLLQKRGVLTLAHIRPEPYFRPTRHVKRMPKVADVTDAKQQQVCEEDLKFSGERDSYASPSAIRAEE